MSTDTVPDIFEKPGVPYSTSADLYSTTTIGAATPTVEVDSVVNYPLGGGAPSSDPLVITFSGTIATPPDMTVDVAITPINVAANFSGGPPPKVYSIFSGTLPPGLSLHATTGVVSGTPTAPQAAANVVFKGTDNNGNSANSNGVPFTVVGTDASFANVVLLLPGNLPTLVDYAAPNPHTGLTLVGSSLSAAQSKWGGSSLLLGSTAPDRVVVAPGASVDNRFSFPGMVSIEFWIYLNGTINSTGRYCFDFSSGNLSAGVLTNGGVNNMEFYHGGVVFNGGALPWLAGQWYFLQWIRDAANLVVGARDGAVYQSATKTGVLGSGDTSCTVGNYAQQGQPVNAYIQDFRITKGIARPVAVPTAAWPTTGPLAWNPYYEVANALSNVNRTVVYDNTSNRNARSGASRTGKIYYEAKLLVLPTGGTQLMVGFANATHVTTLKIGGDVNSISADNLCQISFNGGAVGTYASFAVNDVWNLAYDTANGHFWVGKNGTWFNSGNPAAGTGFVGTGPTGAAMFGVSCVDTVGGAPFSSLTGNFTAAQMAYTVPTGFTALGA